MIELTFVSSNKDKISVGQSVFADHGLILHTQSYEIDEIQGEEPDLIAMDKAKKAYELTKQPVVVSDDSWNIPALNGFPGPYMKSINHWFTVDDFLNLTHSLTDRQILLTQILVYMDGTQSKLFKHTVKGRLLEQPRGSSGPPSVKITALEGDDGLTIAEIFDSPQKHHERHSAHVWHELCEWLVHQP